MTVSFDNIPSNIRVPFAYVEFDGSNAQQGSSVMEYNVLIVGNKLAAGTHPELTPVQVTSTDQAKTLFGEGSVVAKMIESYFANNKITAMTVVAIDDHASGVASTGNVLFSGSASAAGTLSLMIGGDSVKIPVASGDTSEAIVTNLIDEVNAQGTLPVSAVVNGSEAKQIDFTSKNKGVHGNQIDIRFNYYSGEELPAGITTTISAFSAGSQNPDISEVWPVIGEKQYNLIAHPYVDSENLNSIKTELDDRFGPLRQNDGYAISANRGTLGEQTTLGESKNSKFLVIMDALGPVSPFQWAGALAGRIANAASIDPARPFQTLELTGVLAPTISAERILAERNTLLFDGITTHKVAPGSVVVIERVITTYRMNNAGASDTAYLDLNTLLTLSFLRFDYRNTILRKFPRHKLGSDGTRYSPGQAIVTPSVIKAEAITIFRRWERDGLVEDVAQFKRDLIVERNTNDPSRLDTILPPNLINQMRVFGTKISFLL